MGDIGRVEVVPHDDGSVARIVGEVDISNVREVAAALEEAMAGGGARHFVDLTTTSYLDSSGVHVLFALAERLRGRRQELIVVVPEDGIIRRVLDLTDASSVFTIVARLEDARP